MPGGKKICKICHAEFGDPDLASCPNDGGVLFTINLEDPLVGRVLDERFRVIARIGGGGMGDVYLAHQTSVDRPVAIKVLRTQLNNRRDAIKRFLQEAKALSRLHHPNAVTIHDFGQTGDGLLYLTMEFIEGMTLREALRRVKRLPARSACEVVIQLCNALEAAHHLGIVHRDLKPANLMLTRQPGHRVFLKVLDFGLAKLLVDDGDGLSTQSDAIVGTPRYMSPEQLLSKPVEPRSDLYSTGAILFEMLTGDAPYTSDSAASLLLAHLQRSVPALNRPGEPPLVPSVLESIVMRCLAKHPEQRPRSAKALRGELKAVLERMRKPDKDCSRTGGDDDDQLLAEISSMEPLTPGTVEQQLDALMAERAADRPSREAIPRGSVDPSASLRGRDDDDTVSHFEVAGVVPTASMHLPGDRMSRERVRDAADHTPARWPRRRMIWIASVSVLMLLALSLGIYRWVVSPARLAETVAATPALLPHGNLTRRIAKQPHRPTSVEVKGPTRDKQPQASPRPVARRPAEPPVASLQISTTPRGAVVLIAGERIGLSPVVWRTPRSEARVDLLIRKRGYEPLRTKIAPAGDRVLRFTLRRRSKKKTNQIPSFQRLDSTIKR